MAGLRRLPPSYRPVLGLSGAVDLRSQNFGKWPRMEKGQKLACTTQSKQTKAKLGQNAITHGTSRMDLFIRPLGPWNRPTRCGSIEYLPQQRSLCTASSRGMLIDYTCYMNLMTPMSCVHARLRSTRCAGHVACDRTTRYLFSTVSFMVAFDRGRSSTPSCTHTHKHACKRTNTSKTSEMRGADKHHWSVPTAVGARPSSRSMGTCTSLRIEPNPVSASQQRSKLLLLTVRSGGFAPDREAHTRAFPFRSAHASLSRVLFSEIF